MISFRTACCIFLEAFMLGLLVAAVIARFNGWPGF
jgi:hypothetical protein